MEQYLEERSMLFNASSTFSCPEGCERYGCKEPDLHISVSLVDLLAISRISGREGFDVLGGMKKWTDPLATAMHRGPFFIAHQFDGSSLLPIHLLK